MVLHFGHALLFVGALSCVLRAQDKSTMLVQTFLNQLGYQAGPADGTMRPETQDAIAAARKNARWIAPVSDLRALAVDLFVLTSRVEYHGPAKTVGQECRFEAVIGDAGGTIDMGDCPESHLFFIHQVFARSVEQHPSRDLLVDPASGLAKRYMKVSNEIKVLPDDVLQQISQGRLSIK